MFETMTKYRPGSDDARRILQSYIYTRAEVEDILKATNMRADQGRISSIIDSCFYDAVETYSSRPVMQARLLSSIIIDAAESRCRFNHYIEAFDELVRQYTAGERDV